MWPARQKLLALPILELCTDSPSPLQRVGLVVRALACEAEAARGVQIYVQIVRLSPTGYIRRDITRVDLILTLASGILAMRSQPLLCEA